MDFSTSDAVVPLKIKHQVCRANLCLVCCRHLRRGSHIQSFAIVTEEAIAKGIRRIVALTGREAIKVRQMEEHVQLHMYILEKLQVNKFSEITVVKTHELLLLEESVKGARFYRDVGAISPTILRLFLRVIAVRVRNMVLYETKYSEID